MTSRLQKSIEDMVAFCPALRYTPEAGGTGGWWSGPLTPVRSAERLLDLLDDIHHHRPVYTVVDAELRHLPACREGHCPHSWMDRIRPEDLVHTFEGRLYYSGGHDDPRCWITGIDQTNGRHMWSDGSICPFISSSATWDWMTDTVADFAGHVSIFLVSWMVFQRTEVSHAAGPDPRTAGNVKDGISLYGTGLTTQAFVCYNLFHRAWTDARVRILRNRIGRFLLPVHPVH